MCSLMSSYLKPGIGAILFAIVDFPGRTRTLGLTPGGGDERAQRDTRLVIRIDASMNSNCANDTRDGESFWRKIILAKDKTDFAGQKSRPAGKSPRGHRHKSGSPSCDKGKLSNLAKLWHNTELRTSTLRLFSFSR